MNKHLIVLVVIFLYIFVKGVLIEPNSLEVVRYQIKSPELQGARAVFLTDLHLKRKDYKRLNKIITLANQQQPDVVFLGGDFANGHDIKNMMSPDVLGQKLSLLSAPTYTVLGNHDWWAGGEEIKEKLLQNGIRVLENSSVRTIIKGRYVDIVGIADLTTRQPNIPQAFSRTSMPRIVLTHNPDIYYNLMEETTLVLAGHTHGGQFVLPFSPPLVVPSKFGAKFADGLIYETINKMIISKGLGTSILPIRFNCKPEIVVIDFAKNEYSENISPKSRKRKR